MEHSTTTFLCLRLYVLQHKIEYFKNYPHFDVPQAVQIKQPS